MKANPRRKILLSAAALAAVAIAWTGLAGPAGTVRPPAQPQKSQIIRQAETPVTEADWGKMYRYFAGESGETRNVLVAVAVVQPGKAVHRAHRHVMEEYLMLVEGEGTWSLDGKETPAKAGDILYVAPWVYHGLTNTGSKPLTFAVFRYNSKGMELAPKPDDRPDEL
ncbi:MAG: cupin domain-containing protein [Candidatus Sumerlaeia bacterium]|nr:cupin domain-containing protein [Candidatus Sumerlaeia bacterium]